ncbi:aldo-keto reductase [Penicillium chermesinum]|uniref:Aldo-keto reductase n=1 Tax=Penicillium chermesinum TaxID=63820 RepID=A0A9W9PL30_9EURO|nr:aldo-keto reductase [Penicillium chermesinum]KAJ5248699.1 aldo-keto reductase [Penicillium chermesinum]KAJ6150807.1 aldo-keto reductase [Penicillium chermesinum]
MTKSALLSSMRSKMDTVSSTPPNTYYLVEPAVGQAVRETGILWSEIAVVTKFWSKWHRDPA